MNKSINIKNLDKKTLSEIFPPITRNNFVVRKNWYGRNQIITFTLPNRSLISHRLRGTH